jgi:acetyl esterase/lipase
MAERARPVRSAPVLFVVIAVLATVSMPSIGGAEPGPAGSREGGTRYLDPVFSDHVKTSNIPFADVIDDGVPRTLLLDLYEPAGDTATDRPIVIWIHGGSFTSGNKNSTQDFPQYVTKRGYVVASIDYRLSEGASWDITGLGDVLGDLEFITAVWRALVDAQSAIRFFREHAETYGIDPDRISVAGYSAGGITALNTGVWPARHKGEGTADDPVHVSGAILAYAGLTTANFPERGEPPLLMFHGSQDTVVPYDEAAQLCSSANARGVLCDLRTYSGAHGITSDWDELHQASVEFLYEHDIAPAPTIESITPRQVPTYGGAQVQVVGRNFEGTTAVRVGGIDAAFAVLDDERMVVQAPARDPGLVHLVVDNANGTSKTGPQTPVGFVTPGPATASLTGTVRGAGGEPVRGATVELGHLQDGSFAADHATATGPGGHYNLVSVPVAPGSRLRFAAEGYVAELHHDLPAEPATGDPVPLAEATTSTVDALLQPACPDPAPFVDVGVFCGEIAWLSDQGVTQGYGDGTYGPETVLTRQTLVAFLHRLAGAPEPPADAPTFSDVPAGSTFADAIGWAASEGIVLGYGDGTFGPTQVVSRQVFAALLHRIAGSPPGPFADGGGVGPEHLFAVPLSWLATVGYEAVAWQVGEPVPAGDGPTDAVFRRTVAAALYRAAGEGLFPA